MSTVFVLGAGASKGFRFNAPLMSELVSEIIDLCFRTLEHDEKSAQNAISRHLAEILLFISHLYASPFDRMTLSRHGDEHRAASRRQVEMLQREDRLPNLEDILSQIDYAVVSERPISAYWSTEKLRSLRRNLIYAISRVIRDRLANRSGNDLPEELEENFLRRLQYSGSIISLNYDLIMDNLLVDNEELADYGIPIRGLIDRTGKGHSHQRFRSYRETSTKLLKLHGSLNWLYCPRCREIDVTQRQKGAVRYIFERMDSHLSICPICNVPYEPVIITPTFLKSYDNTLIHQLWDSAEAALESANEVVFVGYSLPDADIILRTMLTRALATNRMREGSTDLDPQALPTRCRIILVDKVKLNDEESRKRATETRKRYERLFGKIDDNDYFHGGLAEYIEKRC